MFPLNKLSTNLSLPTIKHLSSLKEDGPSGKFFWFMNEIDVFPYLKDIYWGNPKSYKVTIQNSSPQHTIIYQRKTKCI